MVESEPRALDYATPQYQAAAPRELVDMCGPFVGFDDRWATFGNTGEAAIEAE